MTEQQVRFVVIFLAWALLALGCGWLMSKSSPSGRLIGRRPRPGWATYTVLSSLAIFVALLAFKCWLRGEVFGTLAGIKTGHWFVSLPGVSFLASQLLMLCTPLRERLTIENS